MSYRCFRKLRHNHHHHSNSTYLFINRLLDQYHSIVIIDHYNFNVLNNSYANSYYANVYFNTSFVYSHRPTNHFDNRGTRTYSFFINSYYVN